MSSFRAAVSNCFQPDQNWQEWYVYTDFSFRLLTMQQWLMLLSCSYRGSACRIMGLPYWASWGVCGIKLCYTRASAAVQDGVLDCNTCKAIWAGVWQLHCRYIGKKCLLVSPHIESHFLQTNLFETATTVSTDVHRHISTRHSLFTLKMLYGWFTSCWMSSCIWKSSGIWMQVLWRNRLPLIGEEDVGVARMSCSMFVWWLRVVQSRCNTWDWWRPQRDHNDGLLIQPLANQPVCTSYSYILMSLWAVLSTTLC